MWLSDTSIKRPVFAVMFMAALVALGWISLGRLGVDLFPRIEAPYVGVQTKLNGADPETIETEITDPIEEAVNAVSGMKELGSYSSEGNSMVQVEFELDEDPAEKAQDVRDKIAGVTRDLPQDTERSVVTKMDPDADPVLTVMISGQGHIRDLTHFADKVVKERLQRLSGVGSAKVVGGREREVRVWLDADKMAAHSVSADDIIRAIGREHSETPGGRLDLSGGRQELTVKTRGEVTQIDRLGGIVVTFRNGAPTYLRDVARIVDGMADERSYASLDGRRGVAVEVRKQSGSNIVEVARRVKAEAKKIEEILPPGLTMITARDQSKFIEASARDVAIDLAIGVCLVVLVTLAFLRAIRSTLIVAVAMPVSIISTFFMFYVMGFTINMMTLLALSVSVGLLVDDAIVVLESIYRQIQLGDSPMEAASKGTKKVGLAVMAGTLSVAACFTPIAFLDGMVGKFFYEYGLACVFAVGVSLLVSLTLTPMLSSRTLKSHEDHGWVFNKLEQLYTALETGYGKALDWALSHRVMVGVIALLSVIAGFGIATQIPAAFSSQSDRSEFLSRVQMPHGTGLQHTRQVAQRLAGMIATVDQVETVFYSIGGDNQGQTNLALFYIATSHKTQRSKHQAVIMDDVRAVLTRHAPEADRISVTDVPWMGGDSYANFPIELNVSGPNLEGLNSIATRVMMEMRKSNQFADIQSGFEMGKPEVRIDVDRQRAADLGVSVSALANTVRTLIGGAVAGSFEEGGNRYDIRVRLDEKHRDDVAKLGRLQVNSVSGGLVELANVASFKVASGPATIERRNRERVISIRANLKPGIALGTGTEELNNILGQINIPEGYSARFGGDAERMAEMVDAMSFALLMALVSLYMILASQFNSFTQPIIVMVTAPLSFAGAFVALYITGHEMSLFAQIGLIALMGLVMKNGILLVDYANQARAEGKNAHDAILEAGPIRMRPVLMTAFSTIFGMVPVAISQSDGAEFRNSLGVLVIGGLMSSTFLTLFVVPVIYTAFDDFGRLIGRITGRNQAGQPKAAE